MDQSQNDHLKAYGIAYFTLTKNTTIEWLLNYRGGSFLIDAHQFVQTECRIRGVTFEPINVNDLVNIYSEIDQGNMDIVLLEKKPKIAIYTPPNKQPWDDAVTLALNYAEVDYETLWDNEVYLGKLADYDWLHLHHEDFTGQYGKFYRSHHNAQWYRDQQKEFESVATNLGYTSVHEQKKAIARNIKNYVGNGGFLFAMCSATDSYDIALSMENVDGAHSVFDGTPIDPSLHVTIVKGFMGQTTGFHKDRIKNHIVIMGEDPASDQVKYLHGNFGKGTFTFYGGHDPEDYQHFVGDPPTDLSLHRNSPGYRLILNNILFPAARKKERKT